MHAVFEKVRNLRAQKQEKSQLERGFEEAVGTGEQFGAPEKVAC